LSNDTISKLYCEQYIIKQRLIMITELYKVNISLKFVKDSYRKDQD